MLLDLTPLFSSPQSSPTVGSGGVDLERRRLLLHSDQELAATILAVALLNRR